MEEDVDDATAPVAGPPREVLDRELTLVEDALTLVASGAAPSVTLVGLGGGQRLLRLAVELGDRAGVAVRAWRHVAPDKANDGRFDLLVESHG
jgi:hypothetical protein